MKCVRLTPLINFGVFTFLTIIITTEAYRNGPYFSAPQNVRPQATQPRQSNAFKDFVKVYEARNVEFGFPSEFERRAALDNGNYNPNSPIPIDVDVFYPKNGEKPKIFTTIPRFGQGIPYSLAFLTDVQRPNGTELQPYPSYSWHSSHGKQCEGLTSVYRVAIDSCDQMWVLDSGEIEFIQHCAPQIVVFDLNTDQLIHRYTLPEAMYKTNISRFITPIVDIADPAPYGNCQQAFVYMADATGAGLVVYDVLNNRSWRIQNKYTYPDPDFGTHTVAGESFELLDGAFGMAVTPRGLGITRMLFFHSLSNDAQNAIPLDIANNATNWGNGISSALDKFIPLGKRGVQCGATAMTAAGFLLCGYLEPIGIFGWNIRTPYKTKNQVLLAENPETLQFVSGMKVIRNPNGKDEVWVVSNRLQKIFSGTVNYNEINYRIQRCGVDELLLSRPCS